MNGSTYTQTVTHTCRVFKYNTNHLVQLQNSKSGTTRDQVEPLETELTVRFSYVSTFSRRAGLKHGSQINRILKAAKTEAAHRDGKIV